MRPLAIDKEARERIQKVVEYAEAHRIPAREVLKKLESKKPSGLDRNLCCEVPFGFRCVFSIEQAGHFPDKMEMFWVRIFSCSVPEPGRVPHQASIILLAKLFGFKKGWDQWNIEFEDIGVNHKAVCVKERLDEDETPSHSMGMIVCPHCQKAQEASTGLFGTNTPPEEGNLNICFDCAGLSEYKRENLLLKLAMFTGELDPETRSQIEAV